MSKLLHILNPVSGSRLADQPTRKRRFTNRAYGCSQMAKRSLSPFFKTAGLVLLALFLSVSAYASHYKGGQITYESLGGGTYRITVKSYWRSQLPGSVAPMYSGSPAINTSLTQVSLTPLPDGVTVEKVEQQTVTWSQPGLYTISWTSCCRVSAGANFGPDDMGLFAAVNYNPANPSSSPQFYDLPVFNYAANVPLSFGFNNTDPDGHAQEYTLSLPYGIQNANPYASMIASGFSIANNGIVSWTNPQPGLWLVNVKLAEKINGVLTGAYVYRDFMLNIVATANHAPALTAIGPKTVLEGQPLQFTVNASDPDGNMVTLRASGQPLTMGASFTQTSTGNSPAGTFTWTPPVGSAGNYSVQFIATDNVNPPLSAQITVPITVTSISCTIAATATITQAPCGSTGNTGSISVTATGGTAPYQYSIDNGATFQASGIFNNLTAGTYPVVAKSGTCATAPQNVTIIANPVPVVTLNSFADICINTGTFILTGGQPAGGAYSGPGVTNGIFNPAAAGLGTHQIAYTFTSSAGCTNTATAAVTVSQLPVVSLPNLAPVCASAPAFALNQGQPAGGTYSGPGVTNGMFSATVAGPGMHTITYSYISGGCNVSISQDLVVRPMLTANAGPDKQVYRGYNPMSCTAITASAAGGNGPYTYLWSNGATGANIQVCPTATTVYTVTATDAAGCTATDQVTVSVIDVRCGNKNNKVLICHNGHEICVSANAVAAHLAHGDYLGSCTVNTNRTAVAGNSSDSRFKGEITMAAVPNPFTGATVVEFVLPETGTYSLEIYDLKGSLVQRVEEGTAQASQRYSIAVEAANWPQGIYMARLVTAGNVKITKLMLVK